MAPAHDPGAVRTLTAGEVALCRSLFGAAIAYDRVTVRARKWMPFQPRRTLMAPDGHIWCHPGGDSWRPDYARENLSWQGLFLHEITHVAQAQKAGKYYLPLMRHPFCRYDYDIMPGKPFERYGIEQQAEIVRHAFLLRRGVAVPGKPPLAVYEALLPFVPA